MAGQPCCHLKSVSHTRVSPEVMKAPAVVGFLLEYSHTGKCWSCVFMACILQEHHISFLKKVLVPFVFQNLSREHFHSAKWLQWESSQNLQRWHLHVHSASSVLLSRSAYSVQERGSSLLSIFTFVQWFWNFSSSFGGLACAGKLLRWWEDLWIWETLHSFWRKSL